MTMIRMATRDTGCTIDGCENPWYTRGLCKTHYVHVRATGQLDAFPTKRRRSLTTPVDEIAVDLACSGEPVALTFHERRVAVGRLYERGCSDARIAYLLHVSDRTVMRYRQQLGLPGLPMERIVEMQRAA